MTYFFAVKVMDNQMVTLLKVPGFKNFIKEKIPSTCMANEIIITERLTELVP